MAGLYCAWLVRFDPYYRYTYANSTTISAVSLAFKEHAAQKSVVVSYGTAPLYGALAVHLLIEQPNSSELVSTTECTTWYVNTAAIAPAC